MPAENQPHIYYSHYLVCDECGAGSEDLVESGSSLIDPERLAAAAVTLGDARWFYDPHTDRALCPRCLALAATAPQEQQEPQEEEQNHAAG